MGWVAYCDSERMEVEMEESTFTFMHLSLGPALEVVLDSPCLVIPVLEVMVVKPRLVEPDFLAYLP
jgi:hypothetical protein